MTGSTELCNEEIEKVELGIRLIHGVLQPLMGREEEPFQKFLLSINILFNYVGKMVYESVDEKDLDSITDDLISALRAMLSSSKKNNQGQPGHSLTQ